MRIAVGGIHTECSTYNPVLSEDHHFRVVRGPELPQHPNFTYLQDTQHEIIPVLHARAIPGGPVSHETYQRFKAEFLEGLRAALPLDGVYLAMHGAMFVEGLLDAEGDWIAATREVVGEGCLICASYDLHGNLSGRIIDNLDALTAYRTAPHIDVFETQQRAFDLLVHCLEQGVRPRLSWVPIPVLLPGERTSTEDEPARRLYAELGEFGALPGVLDASLLVGYVWADEPRATASAVITALEMPADQQATATEALAQRYWDARQEFQFGTRVGNVEECVTWAKASETVPVILADSGDNPTGGGVGDRADVLRELLRQDVPGVLVAGIADAPATRQCFEAGLGATVELQVGGQLDSSSPPVTFRGKVLHLDPGTDTGNPQAVVQGGGVTLVLASQRRPYHDLADFGRLGLDPRQVGVLVVKSGYLSPELAPLANPSLMALSPGVVDQDIPRLERRQTHRPTFPFDQAFEWTPVARFSRQPARQA
ncbi:M81 family peptidase (plasmid) [Deinococcus metallilatus]|uniref:M81 family metallopeptidase n=1 Tax=Deinococcus metallilatus TaxID=1211322 RepID=A0AAJ5F9Z4_9DEIO|nr:M81 family metallopeptidase [Deinococcus metallilatus]MBB5293504.1 microcystin degradation protein MlrC [Deinococcus metallilatus]QBY06583.1 M81 family peptidase [Deinococcus metallilatus]RXJ17926.1 M81 family peptidase [Deinococcus metallilatus]TLK32197.1 M81 family metallopeptidase [Deinococcus metallilatus]GMA15276.1 microcystinase C [Deinococcus metallilatus]